MVSLFACATLFASSTLAAKYEQYILAPDSRTIHPASLRSINGTVDGAESLASTLPGSATFQDESSATYDYGKAIGGIVTLTVGEVSDTNQWIGVTFSESSLWISGNWSDATADVGNDVPLWFNPTAPGEYTVGPEFERGSFKYLSLIHNTTGTLEVTGVSIHYTAVPHFAEDKLRDYSGWFHSDDELLNRIWYAGAYTAQICTVNPKYGNSLVRLNIPNEDDAINTAVEWYANTTIANGSSILSDGAKRDRLVWPGDMVVSWPSMLVSTNDKITVLNSLDSLFSRQNSSGQLPYAGIGFPLIYSATYHLHTLIGTAEIYIYDSDLDYVAGKWADWKRALAYSLSDIDSSGLMNVTSSADWLRFGMGGRNIEANSILYHTLQYGIILATALNDTAIIPEYTARATAIKFAINALLWDPTANLYTDNETTTLHPQDGNSWALLANITDSPEKASNISSALAARWGPYGALAPEAGSTVSPFVGFFELQGHAAAKNESAVLELIRRQWGFMLDDPRMTNSTFIEGYEFSGELEYAPYPNDPRISHAHGWSTGPTSVLTFQIAGIQIVEAGGMRWRIAPRLGDLNNVDAGFANEIGLFEAQTARKGDGSGFTLTFSTPEGSTGSLNLEEPDCEGTLRLSEANGRCEDVTVEISEDIQGEFEIVDLPGGRYTVDFTCS